MNKVGLKEAVDFVLSREDSPTKWFLLGKVAGELLIIEANFTFSGTRSEKARTAREQIERIRQALNERDPCVESKA